MRKAIKRGWKSRSRILVWMLVISLVVTGLPVRQAAAAAEPGGFPVQQAAAAPSSGFQDVSPTDWFYDAVVYVQKNGIFSGTGADTFSPKGTMTRAMYVTALGRMAGVDVSEYSTSSFADVPAGIWYAPYVEWATQRGITVGTGDGNFAPDATISREQMATQTLRYLESYQIPYESSNGVTTEPGDLVDVSPWAVESVIKLWQAGLFAGDASGNFNPRTQASRAEAAVLFMRNSIVVEMWRNQGSEPGTDDGTTNNTGTGDDSGDNSGGDTGTGGNNGGSGNNGGGSNPDAPTYTLTFESNGGTAVAAQTVRQGEELSKLPAPSKEGYIFQGWFRDSELSLIFVEGSTVTADTKLYAKYIDNVSNAIQSVPSYSMLDVEPGYTIAINDVTGTLTATEVQAGITLEDIANPDSAGITVTGGSGLFTAASAAEGGLFAEGNTYQLTLTDDRLSFQGQDATTRNFVFSIAKQEAMNIPLNPDMIYLRFADITDMRLNGADVDSPAIPVISTTVGGGDAGLAAANASSGTFAYTGSAEIQVGDAVAIYEGVRPDLRTVDTTGADDGDVAYVQITAIDGSTYAYNHADVKQVLFRPDVLPVSVEADTDEDPDNYSITVAHTSMSYSDSRYAPFGLSELTTVDVGDFIGFYEGQFAEKDSTIVGYGRITSITPAAEMDIITYVDATVEDMENAFNIYQQQAIDGDQLLSDEDIARLEDQMEQQAIASGFVDQAADYLSTLAMQTNEFKARTEVNMLSASKAADKVSVENLTVVASLGTTLKHIEGRTSGVSATLQVGADIVIRIHEESDLVIHMTGTFLEEINLGLGVNGDMQGHWHYIETWLGDIPYWYSIDDYVVTANLDAYSYTGINVTAKIATVEHDKLEDALTDWDKANNGGVLGKVRDIATEIQALIDGVQDTAVDAETLKAQYQEMMENETDWVTLIKKELVSKSVRVALNIVEVNFTAEFVVTANVNLTVGADFNYTTAKRYSATLRVLSFTGTSSTVSLPGDGNYQFTFYVMGTLGLRAGIHMELKAGIGSVELNSIGLSIEPGAYVNLWGYFYYQLKRLNGVQSTQSLGALYVEIGIYLQSAVGAQLGDGLLSASVPIYENTWPLYTVGEKRNVSDFAYPQDNKIELNLAGAATSLAVPESLLTMSTFDLTTGNTDTQAYDRSRFDIQVDNANFRYNTTTGKVEVVDTSSPLSKGNLVITWRGAPLSFTSDPIKRSIPVTWRIRSGEYTLQLEPQNGGVTEVIVAPPNTAISVTTLNYPGYTFDGWYTAAAGGTKVTIPSRMSTVDLHLYAHWIANTNTPYTVEHYLMDPDTRTSSGPAYTEELTGTTDTEIRINSARFQDQGYANGTASGAYIRGDGSTVVRVEYYPTSRTMTFDLNYEGAPQSSITALFGKNISARVPVPTRPGYTFAGWSPEAPSIMPTSNTTYTALWTARENTSYNVVYLKQNIANNTYTVADTETYYGATGTEASLTNPTRSYESFTFDESVPGTVLAAPIAGNGTTVLKLYYKRNSYKMTINYNGAGIATKEVNIPFGATTGLYLGAPTWQGHVFTGWSPAPPTTMPEHDIELVAQWTTNRYTVSFDSNGGPEVADQAVDYGDPASEPAEPTKAGYVFGGWYSDSVLESRYDFATLVTTDLALYAKWTALFTVSFSSNGGTEVGDQTVEEGGVASEPDAPTLIGHTFGGWYSDSAKTHAYSFATPVTGSFTLYAKWTLNSYTVSYNSNGGSAVVSQTVEYNGTAAEPASPTREGHTFGGWYTNAGLTDAYNFTTPVTGSFVLYAKWTLNRYTVSFDSDGGTDVGDLTVEYNRTAAEPTAPTRESYEFIGWYSDSNLTQAYSFATPVTADLLLYAKWIHRYTVSFDSTEGTPVDSLMVNEGAQVAMPVAPTRESYVFAGWYTSAGLTDAYNFTAPVTGNFVLYAKWTLNSYTVSFSSDGGSEVADQTVGEGYQAREPEEPTKAGYVFSGWYSNSNLASRYDFTTSVTTDLMLYAKWTASYTMSFDSDGGTTVDNQTVVEGDVASEPDAPTREGHTFGGWYSDRTLTQAYSFTTPVTGSFVLYAKWTLNSYTVSFNSNGGSAVGSQTVDYNGKATQPAAPTLAGHTFGGWYSDSGVTQSFNFAATPITADVTLYAKWTTNSYTVSFNSNGGSAVGSQTVEYNGKATQPAAPTLAGHTFGGWYSDSGVTQSFSFTATPITTDVTLYAKWTTNSYTVSFNSNGGSAVGNQTVEYNGTAAEPAAPTLAGYSFSGWYRELAGTNAYVFTTPVTANLTLYAKWTATYTVSFDSDGGLPTAEAQTVEFNGTAREPDEPTKDGYTFGGWWYIDADQNEAYYSFGTPVTANLSLYAKWTKTSYTVSFNSNGGAAVNSQTVDPGNKATAPNVPTWKGYTFEGWYMDLSGTQAYDFNAAVTGNLTIYAKWTLSPWQAVGDSPGEAFSFRFALDSQGTPYVITSLNGTINVMKYEGDVWANIGSFAGGDLLAIALDHNDTPYIVYAPEGGQLVVRKYNAGTWGDVGQSLSSGLNAPSLAFDNNDIPYLAYVFASGGSYSTKVAKFDGSSNQWVELVGGDALVSGWMPPTIKFDKNNIPYVFQETSDLVSGERSAFISTYVSGSWNTVVSSSPYGAQYSSFALDPNSVPYIVYRDGSVMTVMRYMGSDWETIGTIELGDNWFGARDNLVFDSSGIPYMIYGFGSKATVVKYVDGNWTPVGNAEFSDTAAYDTGMAIDSHDNLYVFYLDAIYTQGKAHLMVMKHDSGL
ncbi:InlB B-repeat-containing protein [Cohnella fermenti]|uniref:InlB B-repeat-containing protein n=1 Tax=Cohnella fermenti TaxID=2565925 RepID=UPI001454B853|nr:InlB B-repeat-containing protein [Cohnella fermenti]